MKRVVAEAEDEAEQVMAETTKRLKTEEHLHVSCKTFVQQVQKTFEKNIDNLRLYQQIMLEIKNTKFDMQTMILKINDLFHGNDEMIESFNILLAPRTRRTNREDIQESMDFVNNVRTRFRDEKNVCAHFLDVMMRSKTEGSSVKDIFPEIAAIFRDHQDLLDGFRKIVSYDGTHDQEENQTDAHQQEENQIDAHQQEKENSDKVGFKGLLSHDSDTDYDDDSETCHKEEEYRDWFKSAVVWWKKVMSKLSSSDENLNFLRCLYHYSRREIDKTQLLDLLKSQIGMHSELMLDLDQFLEYCDSKGGKKLWGPNYTLMPPPEKRAVVNEKEPELNEVNDRFLCRPKNLNFKGRVLSKSEKKKFGWEDRRHELDLKLESVRSVITQIEQWLVYQGKEKKSMNDFISILNIKCIERIYGKQASGILERMSEAEYPSETLNLVLARMREIEKEQSRVIKKFRRMPQTIE